MSYTVKQEQEAACFARALLMPEQQFLKQVEKHKNKENKIDLKPITDYFHVSMNMAMLRSIELNIFEPHFLLQ